MMIKRSLENWRCALFVGLFSCLPMGAIADRVQENPSGPRMMADLFVARPFGLVLLGLGSAVYVATLPVSLVGGNAKEAGKRLVLGPAEETFVRCLGCSKPGRKEKIQE